MKRTVVAAAILLLWGTAMAAAAPSLGLHTSGSLAGLSYRHRQLQEHTFTPQVIGAVLVSENEVDFTLALRGLFSLGMQGPVQRYAGVGAGYQYRSYSYSDPVHQGTAQIFVGIEVPITTFFPLSASIEALINATATDGGKMEAGNRLGAAIHYIF